MSNINARWYRLHKNSKELQDPTTELKRLVICVMILLGQQNLNWITAYENILTHEEFPLIMQSCTVFNIAPWSFQVNLFVIED